MSWELTTTKIPYCEALQNTDSLDPPAVGFLRPSETKGTISAAIKQNNTIIELLVSLKEDLEDLKTLVHSLLQTQETDRTVASSIDQIQQSLQKLSLGEAQHRKKANTAPFYVFKDPQAIFDEVKQKSQ